MNKICRITVILISCLGFFLYGDAASASTLTLTPGNTSLGIGSTKSFRIVLNTQGEGVNAVSATINYPQDLIEVISVTPSSVFGVQAEQTFGGGQIKLSRGNITAVSGTVTVATIVLRGLAPGSATVYFVSPSAVPRASDSSDSLSLSTSVGSVINVGGAGGGTTASSNVLPQAGSLDQMLLITILGTFFTLTGLIAAFLVKM